MPLAKIGMVSGLGVGGRGLQAWEAPIRTLPKLVLPRTWWDLVGVHSRISGTRSPPRIHSRFMELWGYA